MYASSLRVPFVFDDGPSITANRSVRSLVTGLFPPHGQGLTVEGRPLVNLSLAVNFALGGTAVEGYHVLNIAIHGLAALLLFGTVRRSLLILWRAGAARRNPGVDAAWIGFAAALLWAVHPIQTESVTYVIQRAESLMGLCYLLTLYGFIRGCEAGNHSGWLGLSIAACLCGMASKEVMASAPLILLLYDRTFLSGSVAEALRVRRTYHSLLWATLGLLIVLVVGTGNRGGTAGIGINVTPLAYWETQAPALCHYLRLSVWPSPLIFDYGVSWLKTPWEALPSAFVVAGLAIASGFALWRRWAIGFLGALFFCILAPTSLVPGNRQTLAEHRMYLPLAAVVILVVYGGYGLLRRFPRRGLVGGIAAVGLALCLGAVTIARNRDYASELALYRDTVAKRPDNAYARYNLGKLLAESGQQEEAVAQYREAVRLSPGMEQASYNLGNSLDALRRPREAAAAFRSAIAANPHYAMAHYNLGNVLLELGDKREALAEFAEAVHLHPEYAEARDNLGAVLLDLGRYAEAESQLREALALAPGSRETYVNLGNALLMQAKVADAVAAYRAALALDPSFAPARMRLSQIQDRLKNGGSYPEGR